MKPVIVGESNPFGGDEYYALWDEPEGCTGDRLCRMVMGLRSETYRTSFERRNLLRGSKWSAPRSREAANALVDKFPGPRVWILLGRKVADAFRIGAHSPPPQVYLNSPGYAADSDKMNRVITLPHPSGRCRAWHDPMLQAVCRGVLAKNLPDIPFGEIFKIDFCEEP